MSQVALGVIGHSRCHRSLSVPVAVGAEGVRGPHAQGVVVGWGRARLGGQLPSPGHSSRGLVLEAQVGVSLHQLRHRRGSVGVPRPCPPLLQAFAPADDVDDGDPD